MTTPQDVLDEIEMQLTIHLNITRQRRPFVLRDLSARDAFQKERAQAELLKVFSVLSDYRIERIPRRPARPPSTP